MPWRICAKQWCVRPKELIGNAITHFSRTQYMQCIRIWNMCGISICWRTTDWERKKERENLNVKASFNGVFWSISISKRGKCETSFHHRWNFNPIICQFCFHIIWECVCVYILERYGCARLFPHFFLKFPGKQKCLANFPKNLCKYGINLYGCLYPIIHSSMAYVHGSRKRDMICLVWKSQQHTPHHFFFLNTKSLNGFLFVIAVVVWFIQNAECRIPAKARWEHVSSSQIWFDSNLCQGHKHQKYAVLWNFTPRYPMRMKWNSNEIFVFQNKTKQISAES